jgi:hypothetical protein
MYCGFLYKGETYVFNVVPFGLKTSVASLNRCLNERLGPEILEYITVYVDDLLIATPTFEEHVKQLEKLLKKLIEIGMTIKLSKTLLCRDEVPFIGHKLTPKGIRVDERRIQGINDFSRPDKKQRLQEFLGMCVYLQRFHANYAETVAVLYGLIQGGHPWYWTDRHEEAFQATKTLFKKVVMLHHPELGRRFFIETDSSSVALGAVLYQLNENGQKCIISYCSRTLKQAERNYSQVEKELLSIVYALQRFRYYVANSPITIRNDHKALSFLLSCRLLNARLTRWMLAIQDYSLEIEYIPGKLNIMADSLSRNASPSEGKNNEEFSDNTIINASIQQTTAIQNIPEFNDLGAEQEKDDYLRELRGLLQTENRQEFCSPRHQSLLMSHQLYEGVLYRRCIAKQKWLVCVPKQLVKRPVLAYHENLGHFGALKIIHKLQNKFIWPNMSRQVRRIIAACDICQKTKHPNRPMRGEMICNLPNKAGEIVAIDLYGPLPKRQFGMTYVLVMVDVFTKFVALYPLRRATSRSILQKIINYYISYIRKPSVILCDQATYFTSRVFNRELKKEGVTIRHSSVYFPSSNPAERVMRELTRIFMAYCHANHSAWVKLLPKIARWINISVHE